MRKNAVWLALLALLLLWPVAVVWADDPDSRTVGYKWSFDDGETFFNEDVTIEKGEVVDGDLGVFNGDLALEEGSVVNGEVFVFNGSVQSAGRVNGDLAVIKGDLVVTQAGWVTGDLFGMGGTRDIAGHVDRNLSGLFGKTVLRSTAVVGGDVLGDLVLEPGAQIGGQVERISAPSLPFLEPGADLSELNLPSLLDPSGGAPDTPGERIGRFVGRVLAASMLSLVLLAAGALVVVIWPRPTRRVADCIADLPLRSLGLGLLTFLIAVALEVLAAILLALLGVISAALMATVILIPVGLLLILLGVLLLAVVPLALAVGMLLGWVALAELIGQKVLAALKVQKATPLAAVVVGLLVTVWLPAVLWLIEPCCLAWPVVILLTSVGLGAVILTRFGARQCLPTRPPASPVAVDVLPAESAPALPADAMDQEVGQPDSPPPIE
ncbi:MAG: polymer-forming cytoskeletal protein [Anaerolineae bacterium]|nr:polymer-forming cytoskeletal protein [Anaerolineae bacterium]